jgi:hypothetical protein
MLAKPKNVTGTIKSIFVMTEIIGNYRPAGSHNTHNHRGNHSWVCVVAVSVVGVPPVRKSERNKIKTEEDIAMAVKALEAPAVKASPATVKPAGTVTAPSPKPPVSDSIGRRSE